jgi:hypothetical protein
MVRAKEAGVITALWLLLFGMYWAAAGPDKPGTWYSVPQQKSQIQY